MALQKLPPRFYSPELKSTGGLPLSESESHHLAHVLRLNPGEAIELFNGKGLIGQARVQALQKRIVLCDVISTELVPQNPLQVIIATAVPKSDRFDWLVEKATELGVDQLIPLRTERSTVDPRISKLERLRQTIIAACKQSRRAHVMELSQPMSWPEFLQRYAARKPFVADGAGTPLTQVVPLDTRDSNPVIVACVGPEGGWTEQELELAVQQGCRLVNLGGLQLRVETASLALATWGLLQAQCYQTGGIPPKLS